MLFENRHESLRFGFNIAARKMRLTLYQDDESLYDYVMAKYQDHE